MNRHRIVFMGTPEIALPSLQAVARSERFELVGVITQPDRPAGRKLQLQPTAVKRACAELEASLGRRLPLLSPAKVNTTEVRDIVASWRPDSAVVIAFGQLLGVKFLELFPQGAVNLHASLLPRWRGAAPIQRALMAGDTRTGLSLQRVVKELDAGPLLGERSFPIGDDDDAISVLQKMALLGPDLLENEFISYLTGRLEPKPQDEALVTLAPKIAKEEGHLDQAKWSEGADAVVRRSRGLAAGPGVWTMRNGQRLKIGGLRALSRTHRARPGELILAANGQIEVAAGEGFAVGINWLQPESRPRLSAQEFLAGYQVSPGEVWG